MAPPEPKSARVKPPKGITPAHLRMRGVIFDGKTYPNVVLDFLHEEKSFHTKNHTTLADQTIQSLMALMQTIVYLCPGMEESLLSPDGGAPFQARPEYIKKYDSDRSFIGIKNNSDFTEHEARMRTLVDSYQTLLGKPAEPLPTWKKGGPFSMRQQQLIHAICQMITTAPGKLLQGPLTLPEFPEDPSSSHVAKAKLSRLGDRAPAAMDQNFTSLRSNNFTKTGSVATKDAHSRKSRDRTRSRSPGHRTGNRHGNTAEGARSTFHSRSPLPARNEIPSSPLFDEDSDATDNNAMDEVKTVKTVKVATKENGNKNAAHPTTSLKAIDNPAVTARAKGDRARSRSPGRDGGSLQDRVKQTGNVVGNYVGKNSGREMRSRSPLQGTTTASSIAPLVKKAKDTTTEDAAAAAWTVSANVTPTEGSPAKETLTRATRSSKKANGAAVEQQDEGDLYRLRQGANKEPRRKVAAVTPGSDSAKSVPPKSSDNNQTQPLKNDHANPELRAKDKDGEHLAAIKEELRQAISVISKASRAEAIQLQVDAAQISEPVPTEYDRYCLDRIVWKTKALVEETGQAGDAGPSESGDYAKHVKAVRKEKENVKAKQAFLKVLREVDSEEAESEDPGSEDLVESQKETAKKGQKTYKAQLAEVGEPRLKK